MVLCIFGFGVFSPWRVISRTGKTACDLREVCFEYLQFRFRNREIVEPNQRHAVRRWGFARWAVEILGAVNAPHAFRFLKAARHFSLLVADAGKERSIAGN